MTELLQIEFLVLALGTTAAIGTAVVSWRIRQVPGAKPLLALVVTAAIWQIGSVFSLLSESFVANMLATKFGYVGISFLPVAWIALSLEYAGKESWTTRRTIAAFSTIPVMTLIVVWTSPAHELMWRFDGVTTVMSFTVLDVTAHGPWFWLHTGYSYLLILAGTAVFVQALFRSQYLYRLQVGLIVAAVAIPSIANVAEVTDLSPYAFDPSPFFFAISGAIFVLAIYRFQLLDLVPIARDSIIENMDDGVVVVDDGDRILDVNPAAEAYFGVEAASVVGRPAADVFEPDWIPQTEDGTEREETVTVTIPDQGRTVRIRTSFISDRKDRRRGRMILFQDVTTEVEQRQRLERQNEQLKRQNEHLEEFSNVISHDLRNPLNVAQSYLTLLEKESDSEYVGRIDDAHQEMAALITDLLTLAREGKTVGETTRISLETVVDTARSTVDDDVVEVADDLPAAEADPGRLQQVFENLFRNAIEHGGPDVTVTVGALDGQRGVYVEDDGAGISLEDRDHVFESGYTRSSSGTGLGLSIVKNIVTAHGWVITVTEGSEGGARFEIAIDDVYAPDVDRSPPASI